MKRIFLGYSNRDKVLARLLYHYLTGYIWPDATIFAYEFSLTPGKSWADQATDEASSSDLGVFVLSEYIKKSDFLPQEVGNLRVRKVPVIYVALHEEWRVPPGYDAPIQSFPMFDYKNPMGALPDLGALLRSHLSLPAESEAKGEKRCFEDQHMRGNESVLLSERDAYVLVDAIKCGEKKILILGENALHPIHGGFEHLRRILEGGGTVRVLLLDFNSPMYSLREDIEDARRSARIRADWLASMGNLLELERMRATSRGPFLTSDGHSRTRSDGM